jgi:hypothetical protein
MRKHAMVVLSVLIPSMVAHGQGVSCERSYVNVVTWRVSGISRLFVRSADKVRKPCTECAPAPAGGGTFGQILGHVANDNYLFLFGGERRKKSKGGHESGEARY